VPSSIACYHRALITNQSLLVVRVRPPLKSTDPGYDLIPQRFRESTCEVPSNATLVVNSQQGKKQFIFDRVFEEDTRQQDIWDYVSDSVNSFVQGYNVSILAYGQSGSGKSYTMGTSGPQEQDNPMHMGIVPRAAQTLFEKLNVVSGRAMSGLRTPKRYSTNPLAQAGQADKGWTLKATYVEIYNEQLRDLLVDESVHPADRATVAIREDTKGRILLTGLTQRDIHSAEDIFEALNFGSTIRQTDATAINARSSRSHAVFSLNLVQKKTDSGPMTPMTPRRDRHVSVPSESSISSENVVTTDSKLHFVDLAGSERLKNTGATGDRAKEGISINAGLASLGKVISQLSSKHSSGHISYRDSRLTRLLQDSLGGNAITFMIACVTPANFHMNETLNTLDYARRARSIQVRPKIQQSNEDGDKQRVIEELRATVQHLRAQIGQSEHGLDRAGSVRNRASERPNRLQEELQTQLMDMQENYTALSQRHAKLISEISKARDDENAETPVLNEVIGGDAMERLKRSNSFAEAVEQVVLEYEKTIQSLETSLSSTRGSLASTESSLLEKQTHIAYLETIQQQLQSRLQKAADNEQNNESYLRDLEAKMEGSTSGEEQSAAVISELRKELTRVRESSSNVEDYVTTLEERLAEAEQDQEIMQRDIDRLEQVIERQRSIGRLDNLLSELDSVKRNGDTLETTTNDEALPKVNGHQEESYKFKRSSSNYSVDDDVFGDAGANDSTMVRSGDVTSMPSASTMGTIPGSPTVMLAPRSPAQDDYMADKLENLSQELFDLRSEHETVVTDYDNLQQKYQTALETLAKLEYEKEASNTSSRPESFLADAGLKAEDKAEQSGGQPSSSRSLQEELSSHGEVSTASAGDQTPRTTSDGDERFGMQDEIAVQADAAAIRPPPPPQEKPDVRTLRRVNAEKDSSIRELTQNYKDLADEHQSALSHLEDLKQELHRVSSMRPPSTSPSSARPTSPALPSPGYGKFNPRRKSEDQLGTDRASKSCASLKNIAIDNLENDSVARHNFELNLSLVVTELHARSERVQSLEAELTTVKKEMEGKQAIISGLTRERSSLKANSGTVDFSIVGQMRDQLMESEQQIRNLHEQNSAREKEFQDQIDSLKHSLEQHRENSISFATQLPTPTADHVPGDFPQTPANELSQAEAGASRSVVHQQDVDGDVKHLQAEIAAWETKHNSAMESMKVSETNLLSTISELQESLRKAEQQSSAPNGLGITDSVPMSEDERTKHKDVVDALQREVDDYKTTAHSHVTKLEQLEQAYAKILAQVDEESQSNQLTQKELQTHRDLVSNLENQLQVHQGAIALHQESLENLQTSHSKEIEELKAKMEAAEKEAKDHVAASESKHNSSTNVMQAELTKLQAEHTDLLAAAAAALGSPTDSNTLRSQIEGLVDEGKELHTRHTKATNDVKLLQEELQTSQLKAAELQGKFDAANEQLEAAQKSLDMVITREKKSSRLVEELEEQLNSNFDSHQAATNRLSRMETATVQARQEIEKELEDLKARNSMLEVSLHQEAPNHESVLTTVTATSLTTLHGFRPRLDRVQQSGIAVARSSRHRPRSIRITAVCSPQVCKCSHYSPPNTATFHSSPGSARLRPRHLANSRQRLASCFSPHLQRRRWRQRWNDPNDRRTGSTHPHDREASLRREAADRHARRSARRSRNVGQPYQDRHGQLEAQVPGSGRRTRQLAQGAQQLAREPAGR
jgi:DNA repair exonuclease SbcCD ATPase subunit